MSIAATPTYFTIGKHITFIIRGVLYSGNLTKFTASELYELSDDRTCYELELSKLTPVREDGISLNGKVELWYDSNIEFRLNSDPPTSFYESPWGWFDWSGLEPEWCPVIIIDLSHEAKMLIDNREIFPVGLSVVDVERFVKQKIDDGAFVFDEEVEWSRDHTLLMIRYADVEMIDGMIYFKFELDDAFEHNLDCLRSKDFESESHLYEISCATRQYIGTKELQGLALQVCDMWELVCESYFGYECHTSEGTVSVTLLDLRNEYERYRKYVDPTRPSFGTEIDRILSSP